MLKRIVLVMAVSMALAAPSVVSLGAEGDAPQVTPAIPPALAGPSVRTSTPAASVLSSLRMVHPQMIQMLTGRLNLTPEQEGKVRDLLAKAGETQQPLIEVQRTAADEFVTMLTKNGVDQAAIIAAGQKAVNADAALLTEKVKTFLALRAMFTGEQRDTFDKVFEQSTMPWRARTPRVMQFPTETPAPPAPAAPGGETTEQK